MALEGTHEVSGCCATQVLVANHTRNLPSTTIAHLLSNKVIPRHSVEDVLWESPVDVSDLGWRCMFKSGPLLLRGILLPPQPSLEGENVRDNVWAKWDIVENHIVEPRKSEI